MTSHISIPRIARLTTFSICAILSLITGSALAADKEDAPKPATNKSATKPVVVHLVHTKDGFQLLRGDQPYFIKGAGGSGSLSLLAAAGGNSVRTWGADHLQAVLDDAQKNGLTVAVGIWLGHERHGFNYNDSDQVAKQFETVRETILRYKDHPAVLLWGLGNEMEGYEKGDNAAIWSAINNLAVMAKQIDPNHPTMTVVAEIGGDRVKNIHRLCPDIDIVGINSYGGVTSIPKRYKEAGGTKPYIITEYGPPGVWEVTKNAWGAVPEPTSTEKAGFYRRAYEQAMDSQRGQCLGGYAFTWGNKQEATATWFGMILPDGSRLAAVDALTEAWTGKPPANRCPVIEKFALVGSDQVEPGETVHATLTASDPEKDELKVRWVLQREPAGLGTGGDAEEAPPTYPDAIVKSTLTAAEVKMPADGGAYRLFAYVYDGHGGAAMANVPLKVKGEVTIPNGKAAKLPLIVYDESDREQPPFIPAGWMGNTKALKLDPDSTDHPHAGKTCLRLEFQAKDGWGGIVWQSPANDWGDKPGGWNLTGAKELSFWARGEKGGETISVSFGLIAKDKPYFDTAQGKLDKIALTKDWKEYTIDLQGKDLTRVKSGFVVTVAGEPMTVFLDDIQYK